MAVASTWAGLGWCRWRGVRLLGWQHPKLLRPGILAGLMFGIEFLLIDQKTDLREFKKELRWNDLYYHLAQGI